MKFKSVMFAITILLFPILTGNANGYEIGTITLTGIGNASTALFGEGFVQPDDPWDLLAMYLSPVCSNLPDVKTSVPGLRPWRETVSDVALDAGTCIRLFKELNCCGEFYDLSNSSRSQLVHSDWNDKLVSFIEVDCDSPPYNPSDCNALEKDSFLAIFYNDWRYQSGRLSFALEVSSRCANLPKVATESEIRTFPVLDIYVPKGKCMILFDESNCGGESFLYSSNGWFLSESDWAFRAESFVESPCDIDLSSLPCPTDLTDDVEKNRFFSATFYEGYRDSTYYYRRFTVNVTSTCANVPTDIAGPRNLPWNEEISDVTLPENECICLFDQPDCSGASYHTEPTQDLHSEDLVYNFNDKTKSYRACYGYSYGDVEARRSTNPSKKGSNKYRGLASSVKKLYG